MEIHFTAQVFREGGTFVAYAPELDISSCGNTKHRAQKKLLEAVRLFLDEADHMGTLERILEESGYVVTPRRKLSGPILVSVQRASLPLSI